VPHLGFNASFPVVAALCQSPPYLVVTVLCQLSLHFVSEVA
jgi:hypothetical protein